MTLSFRATSKEAMSRQRKLQSRSGARSGGSLKPFTQETRRHIMQHVQHWTQKEKESPALFNLAVINGAAHDQRHSDNDNEIQNAALKKIREKNIPAFPTYANSLTPSFTSSGNNDAALLQSPPSVKALFTSILQVVNSRSGLTPNSALTEGWLR